MWMQITVMKAQGESLKSSSRLGNFDERRGHGLFWLSLSSLPDIGIPLYTVIGTGKFHLFLERDDSRG